MDRRKLLVLDPFKEAQMKRIEKAAGDEFDVIRLYLESDKADYEVAEVLRDEPTNIEDMTIEAIRRALERHKGNRKYAARELQISERTLYRKIKEYGL